MLVATEGYPSPFLVLIDGNSCLYAPLSIAGSDFHPPFARWANQWGASHYGLVVVHLSAVHCAGKHDLSEWPGDSAQQGSPREELSRKLLLITDFY